MGKESVECRRYVFLLFSFCKVDLLYLIKANDDRATCGEAGAEWERSYGGFWTARKDGTVLQFAVIFFILFFFFNQEFLFPQELEAPHKWNNAWGEFFRVPGGVPQEYNERIEYIEAELLK